jgi:hypothetical protein
MSDIPTCELELYWLNETGVPVHAASARPFVAADYSRYKYGATACGAVFALALADAFQRACPRVAEAPCLLIASAPYKYVPTAAHALARAFADDLNQRRYFRSLPPARLIKIGRQHLSPDDYGQFSNEQRRALMQTNPLLLDRTLLQDAHLVVIDDLKVTGAHQDCLIDATDGLPLLSRTFLYIAKFLAPPGALDPTIEDQLNHSFAKKLADVMEIVRSPDFAWNARLCRFLLSARNRAELPAFLMRMPDRFLLDLSEKSRGDGYDVMDAYRKSYMLLQMALRWRGLIAAPCGAGSSDSVSPDQ